MFFLHCLLSYFISVVWSYTLDGKYTSNMFLFLSYVLSYAHRVRVNKMVKKGVAGLGFIELVVNFIATL